MNISKILGQVSGQAGGNSIGGMDGKSLATGAAAGSIVGLMANSKAARQVKRNMGRKFRRHGGAIGLAVVGGLALKAYSDHRVKKVEQGALEAGGAQPAGFITDDRESNIEAQTLVIRAMIAAASCDGHIDEAEKAAIMEEVKHLPKSATGTIMMEMATPASPEMIAKDVESVEQAVQVYTAARLTVDIDTPEEEVFLKDLGQALKLGDELVAQIEETVSAV